MKIKAVCEKTGLTDRTVRYYIEEKLISPSYTENYLGRKSFDFSDEDIVALCDIAVLRSFDFSIEEIRTLSNDPNSSLIIINAVKERIQSEVTANQKKLSALASLNNQTVYTISEIAKELSKPEDSISTEESIKKNGWQVFLTFFKAAVRLLIFWFSIVISLIIIAVSFIRYEYPIINPIFLSLTIITFIPAFLSLILSKANALKNGIVKIIIFSICIICIPISIFTSIMTIRNCEHTWKEIAVEAEISCSQEGRIVKKCDSCQEVIIDIVEKKPHTVVYDNAIEATCTSDGLSEGQHCSVCGAILVKQEILNKIAHTYVKTKSLPTCGEDGYIDCVCSCGDSYRDSIIWATEKHDFEKNGELGYKCRFCSLEVCEYGYVDGSIAGDTQNMQYYITGTADKFNEQERTLVIYGSGKMPEPAYKDYHPWRYSLYVEEIKAVVICAGITSVANGAFSGGISDDTFYGNPFHSVESFTVKGNSLTVDLQSSDMSGIECDITYLK